MDFVIVLVVLMLPVSAGYLIWRAYRGFLDRHRKQAEANLQTLAEERRRETVCEDMVYKHMSTLLRRREQLITTDDYGTYDATKWLREIHHFLDTVVARETGEEFIERRRFDMVDKVLDMLRGFERRATLDAPSVDELDGVAYEHYCASVLRDSGWDARLTAASGDQGVDIIAQRGSLTLAVQCKKYSCPVGNAAVQEVVGAIRYVGATHGAVVSNAEFTRSAHDLARANSVLLLHHSDLSTVHNALVG